MFEIKIIAYDGRLIPDKLSLLTQRLKKKPKTKPLNLEHSNVILHNMYVFLEFFPI